MNKIKNFKLQDCIFAYSSIAPTHLPTRACLAAIAADTQTNTRMAIVSFCIVSLLAKKKKNNKKKSLGKRLVVDPERAQ